jgi:hypothetical protein
MLGLLTLPIELLRLAFYALQGLVDALRAHNRLRSEFTVLINASRDAVWRLGTAHRFVLDGPPTIEMSSEPLPDSPDLWLTRITVGGQPQSQIVSHYLERDETKGIMRARLVAHPLSKPPEGGRNVESGFVLEATPEGTALTMFNELTVRSFRDRIIYPVAPRRMANLINAKRMPVPTAVSQPLATTDCSCRSWPS